MAYNDLRVYVHFVWTTKYRQATLPESLERSVFRIIESEARKLECKVVALNGTDNHIHVLVQMGSQATISRLVNQLKGVTALFINDEASPSPLFEWQRGYGAYSVGKNQIRPVIDYIARQKERHANNALWSSLEPKGDSLSSPGPTEGLSQ